MDRRYQHLSSEERGAILAAYTDNKSARAIARMLGRNVSTVARELKRGLDPDDEAMRYCPTRAAQGYRLRRQHCGRKPRLVKGNWLFKRVEIGLCFLRWSPEQIAGRLRRMHPDNPECHISHETIYASIYAHPKGELKKAMIEALRQQKATRGRRRTTPAGGSMVPDDLRIVNRPEDIESRLFPGHWEGDFIKGAYNRSAVGTVVERKTRYVVLSKMNGCTALDALEGFSRQLGKQPAIMRQSFTYDRGSEMACHEELARRLKLDIWFADPHAPWQRGSNENTNGLLREFMPKGTDLSEHSQTYLNDLARLLNQRPRKALGFATPEEAMAEELQALGKTVALDS